jgi:hypothetical protein
MLDLTPQLNRAIPGFSANTSKASSLIKELMAGKLTTGERRSIYDAGAERGTLNGMPGSTGQGGSLFANADLRNIGLESGQRQQQGFGDLLQMLQGYSGTVLPTDGQEQQNQQFGQDLNFRTTNADRNFGLAQSAEQRAQAEFQKKFGPKEYSQSETNPVGQTKFLYKYFR